MDHINGFKAAVAAVLGCLTALWGWFGWLVVAWVACMLLDYATGTAAALKAGKWSCKAAREGLWHKVGAMAAVLVAAILDGVLGLILDSYPRPDPALRLYGISHGAGAGLVYPDRAGEYRGKCRAAGSPFACMAVQGYCSAGVRRGQCRR